MNIEQFVVPDKPLPPIKGYDVLVYWYTGWGQPKLTHHSKWHRCVQAETLPAACETAVAQHQDVWHPQVSMCWPVFGELK